MKSVRSKRPNQLLGLLRSLLIFSSFVQIHNTYAGVFDLTAGFVAVATNITIGLSVPTASKSNFTPMWEHLGFSSAEEMQKRLEETYGAHAKTLEGIAERAAVVENMKLIPDGFVTPKGTINKGKIPSSFAGPVNQDNDPPSSLLAEVSSSPKNTALAKPLMSAEGVSSGLASCQPGSPCAKANEIADQLAKQFDSASDNYLSSGAKDVGPLGYASGIGAATKGNRVPAALAANGMIPQHRVGNFGKANIGDTQYAKIMQGNLSDANSKQSLNGEITENLNKFVSDSAKIAMSSFDVMPEGWFAETRKMNLDGKGEVEVSVRGALDKPYDPSNPESLDNFVQVLYPQKGKDPVLLTLKKEDIAVQPSDTKDPKTCSIDGCDNRTDITRFHGSFKEAIAKVLQAKRNGVLGADFDLKSMPFTIAALTQLQIAANDPKSFSRLQQLSQANHKIFTQAITTGTGKEKIELKERWDLKEYIQNLDIDSLEEYYNSLGGKGIFNS